MWLWNNLAVQEVWLQVGQILVILTRYSRGGMYPTSIFPPCTLLELWHWKCVYFCYPEIPPHCHFYWSITVTYVAVSFFLHIVGYVYLFSATSMIGFSSYTEKFIVVFCKWWGNVVRFCFWFGRMYFSIKNLNFVVHNNCPLSLTHEGVKFWKCVAWQGACLTLIIQATVFLICEAILSISHLLR